MRYNAITLTCLCLVMATVPVLAKDKKPTEAEMQAWLEQMEWSMALPEGYLVGLIFYPHQHDLGENPTAEEIIDRALRYRPIQL